MDCALAVNAIMLNTAKSSCLIIEFFMTVDFEFCIVFEFSLFDDTKVGPSKTDFDEQARS
jgi:hypothetical protein